MTDKEILEQIEAIEGELIDYVREEVSKIRKENDEKFSALTRKIIKIEQDKKNNIPSKGNKPKDLIQKSNYVFCESSSDGKSLTKLTKNPYRQSGFFILNLNTGEFEINTDQELQEYIIANRDYVLTACNQIINSSHPKKVITLNKGKAYLSSNGKEWIVTQKMNVELK